MYFFTSSNHFCWNCNSSELSRPQIMRNSPTSTSLSVIILMCTACIFRRCTLNAIHDCAWLVDRQKPMFCLYPLCGRELAKYNSHLTMGMILSLSLCSFSTWTLESSMEAVAASQEVITRSFLTELSIYLQYLSMAPLFTSDSRFIINLSLRKGCCVQF